MIDLNQLQPTRTVTPHADGSVTIHVQPPAFMHSAGGYVHLSSAQFVRYQQWIKGHGLIQELLGELSADAREMLMSGLVDADLRAVDDSVADRHGPQSSPPFNQQVLHETLQQLYDQTAAYAEHLAVDLQSASAAKPWAEITYQLGDLIEKVSKL